MVTKQINIHLIPILFLICKVYGQTDEPKSVLLTKFYSYETLALVVRFDKGIDSIHFPIDTTLIKIDNRRLDINGQTISPKKVYHEYRFTAKVDTMYRLPSAIIWSDNTSYDIPINENVQLKKPRESLPLSKSDSLKHVGKEIPIRVEKYERAKKRRLEGKIDSRISKSITKRIVLLWTDKNILKINDNFRIVIESNMEFNSSDISNQFIQSLSEKFSISRNSSSTIIENGFENHYKIFTCKALSAGKITIEPFTIRSESKNIKTNKWIFDIIE